MNAKCGFPVHAAHSSCRNLGSGRWLFPTSAKSRCFWSAAVKQIDSNSKRFREALSDNRAKTQSKDQLTNIYPREPKLPCRLMNDEYTKPGEIVNVRAAGMAIPSAGCYGSPLLIDFEANSHKLIIDYHLELLFREGVVCSHEIPSEKSGPLGTMPMM